MHKEEMFCNMLTNLIFGNTLRNTPNMNKVKFAIFEWQSLGKEIVVDPFDTSVYRVCGYPATAPAVRAAAIGGGLNGISLFIPLYW